MHVEKDRVVSFHYSLREVGGDPIEDNKGAVPMAYLHGHGNLLPALEAEMEGMTEGETRVISLPPEKAYGLRNENALQKVPVKHLIGTYKRLMPKMIVRVNTNKGERNASVIKAGKFMVELDMNHPFAGVALEFTVEVLNIREAQAEEIAHGHAHGDGGHHH
ncbi:FKBP-type peptidyl-prolyl cis-trans isomerase [Teredinibacter turnerae]|uniref:Peptidyl-prolyl cis-trans isomerase n=1 Tax=Teredinibacter turnerae (strain ATCC 39867 / T7901) TaxID=377629 RepID=C5BNS3_TERTT|nr:FKBP-type peptidyl-prolyl cis-trans isomerase [Teredinibacter turnerae]ACR11153.1 fkbp-type peptidyl-prolyl cis-trans isomerase IlpA [Teredinibacter turnerae T7901]